MKRIFVLTVSCLLFATASAAAQGPVGDAYGGAGAVAAGVADTTGSGSTTPTQGSGTEAGTEVTPPPTGIAPVAKAAAPEDLRGDSLPFTGFDVILMLTGASVLLIAGVGMRRLSRLPI